MILFYIAIFFTIILGLKYNEYGYNKDYMSFDTTNAIKGIFILFVFIKHATPYVSNSGYLYAGLGDEWFKIVNSYVGQWIVAMFLFYSGYGIMESIKKKGERYIASIPTKRLLNVLLNFDIAVLIYIVILYIYNGEWMGIEKYVLSFVGWESVGNSNWYIFVIMLAYLATYVSFKLLNISHKNYALPCIITNILLLVLMVVLSYLKEKWWYDTILCFGIGLLYSNYKCQIEEVVKKKFNIFFVILLLMLVTFSIIPIWAKGLIYNMFSIIFCLIIVMITMKFKINNRFLVWLGQNLFPLYIYQGILMIILSSIAGGVYAANYPILYVISCFAITVIVSYYYRYWTIRL